MFQAYTKDRSKLLIQSYTKVIETVGSVKGAKGAIYISLK